jgi:hypothetical protein
MIHIGIPSGIWQTIAASNFTFHKAPSPRTASTSIAYGQGEVSAAWGARRGEPSLLLVRSASQRIWDGSFDGRLGLTRAGQMSHGASQ